MPRRRKVAAAGIAIFALGIGVGATGSTFSAFTSTTANSGSFSSAPDWTPPAVTASVVGKSTGGTPAGGRPGAVKRFAGYYAYANVTDSGNPAAGVNTVTANLNGVTSGQTAAALTTTGGPWTVDGTTYNYRSAQLFATATGTTALTYPVAAVDLASNSQSYSFPVTVDNTVPTASDVQIVNGTGTAGRADAGDKVTLTFSEAIDPYGVIPSTSWNGTTAANVVVRLVDGGGGNDTVQVWNSANNAQVNLGSVNLASKNYTASTITFGATGTASTMVQAGSAITITLGTASATASTVVTSTTSVWTPSASAFDIAGNAVSTATATESGSADAEF